MSSAGAPLVCALVCAAMVPAASFVSSQTTYQTPVFRSGVELVAVDVQVVDREGRPLIGLPAEQFDVAIDGRRRQVVSADLVRYSLSPTRYASRVITPSSPDGVAADRIFVLAFDQFSFRVGPARAAAIAARHFIDRLQPDDVVGLFPYPGNSRLDLTHARAPVRGALDKIVGMLDPPTSEFNLSISEVIDITAGDDDALARVVRRECARGDTTCARRVQGEAFAIGAMAEMQITESFNGLRALLGGLAHMPGRKTVVLISGGLLATDRAGGRPDVKAEAQALGRQAAAANTNLYVLHMDTSFLDSFSADTRRLNMSTLFRDSAALGQGLEVLAGAAGGALFRIQAGTPESAFERVLREASAYYLLGVEVADADRDGKPHFITVKLRQSGATLRNRPMVVIPRSGG